jgi:hypothetical protein
VCGRRECLHSLDRVYSSIGPLGKQRISRIDTLIPASTLNTVTATVHWNQSHTQSWRGQQEKNVSGTLWRISLVDDRDRDGVRWYWSRVRVSENRTDKKRMEMHIKFLIIYSAAYLTRRIFRVSTRHAFNSRKTHSFLGIARVKSQASLTSTKHRLNLNNIFHYLISSHLHAKLNATLRAQSSNIYLKLCPCPQGAACIPCVCFGTRALLTR